MLCRKPACLAIVVVGLSIINGQSGQCGTTTAAHFSCHIVPADVRAGEVANIVVDAKIDRGWHLYSLVPVPSPGPSATSITVEGKGISPDGPATEDAPIHIFDSNFGKEVSYHETKAFFSVPVRVDTKSIGPTTLSVSINFQTCNSTYCLPPTIATIDAPYTVAAGSPRTQYLRPIPLPVHDGSLLLFLLAAFGAGFLSLFTPCVFPLIPITLASFIKQADGNKRRLVLLSSSYSLGIIALYVAVGSLTGLFLGASGIGRIASNPWINLVAFVIFLVFALSFFEAIQIPVPANLGHLQLAAKKKGGAFGLATLGIVFVLASFTCTAPFIGTLLVTAASGNYLRPLLGMLVFAVAFVSPFVIFSFVPQWISSIPKSGIWLTKVKTTLGFIEIAAALKFLSNADLVWQWKILTQPVMLSLWAILFLCCFLYLVGFWECVLRSRTQKKPVQVSLVGGTVACLFLFVSMYCVWGLVGKPINPYFAAYLPPAGYGGRWSNIPSGLPWLSSYDLALAEAHAQGKPLLIDFTGYTCTNCRLNEKQVFPAPKVQSLLNNFVRVQLYTDGGAQASTNEALQINKFGDAALPLYGVLDSNSAAVVAQTAGVQSVNGFAAFLKTAVRQTPTSLNEWQPFNESAISSAVSQHKQIVIDFTANWCTNCKAIEDTVFVDQSVKSALSGFATYRSDLTNYYSPQDVLIEQKYSLVSLPAIVFLNCNGVEIPGTRVSGLLSISQFLAKVHIAQRKGAE